MSYIINNSRGNIVAVVDDGTVNTTATDLALIGRSVTNYGEYQNENYVYLLENFANGSAPLQPVLGQLWYNSATDTISAYSTANTWVSLASENYVDAQKISPAFTGVPTAPTASSSTNTTQLATTAFVQNQLSSASGITTPGTITGGNLVTGGLVSAVGNITGGNLLSSGLVSVTGNITGGNINTAGAVSATGNVIGANFIGNVIPPAGGAVSTTGNVSGGNILTSGLISAAGNITSAANVAGTYFIGNGSQLTGLSAAVAVTKFVNGSSEGNAGSSGGNISFTVGGTSNVLVLSSTTAYFGSDVSVSAIQKTGSNLVGNIGSSANYFNRVFATATTALYADVAERFAADELLEPGTVVELGGLKEITRSQQDLSENVFGVISTRPAYTMNGGAGEDDTHPPVAMTGRVPVKAIGIIRRGDRLVSAGSGVARAAQPGEATAFNVIGRSLEDKHLEELGTIEAIVTIK